MTQDSLYADTEPVSNLPAGATLGNQLEHFPLPVGQAVIGLLPHMLEVIPNQHAGYRRI